MGVQGHGALVEEGVWGFLGANCDVTMSPISSAELGTSFLERLENFLYKLLNIVSNLSKSLVTLGFSLIFCLFGVSVLQGHFLIRY